MYVSDVRHFIELTQTVGGKDLLAEYLRKLEECDCEILEDVEFL